MGKRKYEHVPQLHVDGYVVYKNCLNITDAVMENIYRQVKHAWPIFNYTDTHKRSDSKRKQTPLKRSTKGIKDLIANTVAFVSDNINSKYVSNEWVILHSLPGCQVQAAHTDYEPTEQLKSATDTEMPLLALISLMPGTTIDLWPGSIGLTTGTRDSAPIHRKIVALDRGDLLIFRGDLVHAGSAYTRENIRLHAYLDSANVPRTFNRTFVIHYEGSDELSKILI